MTIRLSPFPLLVALFAAAPTLAADEAGRITSAIGVVSVQRTDGSMAVLSKGSAVTVGDTLRTQAESRAEIQTQDRARVIVRPDSTFKIEGYRFTQSAPQDDSTVLRLLKGGLRSISGLLGQRRPAAYQLNTATATIGIRGTDFVVRECQDDCAQETREAAKTLTPRTPGYVARVVAVQGSLTTSSGTRAGKPLAVGAPIYAEDLLETGPKSHAALIFQDGTRVVLQADTRFAVNGYRYEPSKAETGSLSLRLLRGGLRVLTGLIGQRNPQRFQVTTSVATIGIRGTGFDVTCTGPCTEGEGAQSTADVPDGLHVYTWRGRNVTSTEPGETETVEDQALIVTSRTDLPRLLESVPAFFRQHPAPRPDTLEVDLEQLFGLQQGDFAKPGTYVLVRDGTVLLRGTGIGPFELNKGEVGYLDPTGTQFIRLGLVPVFLDRDRWLRDGEPDQYGCAVR